MSDPKTVSANDDLPVVEVENQKENKVAYETYQRVLAEAKTAKERLRVLEASQQANQENKMKEQNEWKALAEAKEKALLETTTKLNDLEGNILESIKINAFQRLLGGKIKDDSYYQFVDTEKIAYNPETKRVDEESVKLVVAEFVKRHSSLVEFKAGKMPNEAASTNKLNTKSISNMSKEELEKHIVSLSERGLLK